MVACVIFCACTRVADTAPRKRSAGPSSTTETSSETGEFGRAESPADPTDIAPPSPLPNFASVAHEVAPSVVTVISTLPRRGSRHPSHGIGSGLLVSAAGQILTNEHVVAGATKIHVELANLERVEAKLIYGAPKLDLALLQLVAPTRGPQRTLRPARFRDRAATPGEWVMAVGQPFGLGDTVTVGVVSGVGRDHADLGRPKRLDPDGIWSFIQTDASVNIGNSGGPLVDTEGRVLGLTTAVRRDGQGLAFAIPSAMAVKFLAEVRAHGRFRFTRLGISAHNVGPEQFPSRLSTVQVTKIDPNGPGSLAGVKRGDVIVTIDGQAIRRVAEVAYLTQLRGVNESVRFELLDDEGTKRTVLVVPDAAR